MFWFSTHKLLLYLTSLADPVSIGASSPAVESTLGGVPVPFACDLLRFGLSFSSCPVSLNSSWESQSSIETLVVVRFGFSVRGCWSFIVIARTSPSFGGVVYHVHECFVDSHNKKTAPSKRKAW